MTFSLLDWAFFDILNGKIKIFNFLAATDFGNLQRTNSLICSTIDTKIPTTMMDLATFKIGKFWNNHIRGIISVKLKIKGTIKGTIKGGFDES